MKGCFFLRHNFCFAERVNNKAFIMAQEPLAVLLCHCWDQQHQLSMLGQIQKWLQTVTISVEQRLLFVFCFYLSGLVFSWLAQLVSGEILNSWYILLPLKSHPKGVIFCIPKCAHAYIQTCAVGVHCLQHNEVLKPWSWSWSSMFATCPPIDLIMVSPSNADKL